jgi:hypothetical protein
MSGRGTTDFNIDLLRLQQLLIVGLNSDEVLIYLTKSQINLITLDFFEFLSNKNLSI